MDFMGFSVSLRCRIKVPFKILYLSNFILSKEQALIRLLWNGHFEVYRALGQSRLKTLRNSSKSIMCSIWYISLNGRADSNIQVMNVAANREIIEREVGWQ